MDGPATENFLFVADKTFLSAGRLYELRRTDHFKNNVFVIIPYSDPQVKATTPLFFDLSQTLTVPETTKAKEQAVRTIVLTPDTSKKQYLETVNRLKKNIQLGNIYEINYCIRFSAANVEINPWTVFHRLNTIARAPYSALVKIGNTYIISASPELFLEKKGSTLITKPIKGTIKRGHNKQEDEKLKDQLYTSMKERTENVMAVDVARNDLSRLAAKGSVKVNKLYNIETFETVHQMVSTVSCQLKDHWLFDEIIEATFPMASMTGAPKLRAMALIGENEHFNRHYYSGAMGLIDEKGDFTLAVNIRCIFYNIETRELSIAVGGAITYLSDAEKEYEECLLKAEAMLSALGARIA
jgi:para-aminobenzoate synthetase component 1